MTAEFASVAQWQRSGLLTRGLEVQVLPGAPTFSHCRFVQWLGRAVLTRVTVVRIHHWQPTSHKLRRASGRMRGLPAKQVAARFLGSSPRFSAKLQLVRKGKPTAGDGTCLENRRGDKPLGVRSSPLPPTSCSITPGCVGHGRASKTCPAGSSPDAGAIRVYRVVAARLVVSQLARVRSPLRPPSSAAGREARQAPATRRRLVRVQCSSPL